MRFAGLVSLARKQGCANGVTALCVVDGSGVAFFLFSSSFIMFDEDMFYDMEQVHN